MKDKVAEIAFETMDELIAEVRNLTAVITRQRVLIEDLERLLALAEAQIDDLRRDLAQ